MCEGKKFAAKKVHDPKFKNVDAKSKKQMEFFGQEVKKSGANA